MIGLVGGMSWESSALYYRLINQAMARALGGHHNAASVLYTLDFAPLLEAAAQSRWSDVAQRIAEAGRRLKAAGADFILLTANTAHAVASEVEATAGLPLLHIAEPVARALRQDGVRRAGLVGTRHVTQGRFYAEWLGAHAGVTVEAPLEHEAAELDRIILGELTLGRVDPASRERYFEILRAMRRRGAEGIIVACTELPLLVQGGFAPPAACYDSTLLHAERAVELSLESA
ncbi:MAG: hypothetical protein A3G81_09145 [Betaproteobacteria bacterium RIFCSPLOWO2_12_FULL_65_14]|nr:MAG: hypothetical protein A3G81_09145 [Betaproteobacteria bacterium RIFCSPLOWO2_12_FULL_65_14]